MDYFNQESERLTYRRVTVEDIPKWMAFFVNNDHLGFMGMDLSFSHEELCTEWINAQFQRYKETGFGHLAAIEKSTGDMIGLAGIIQRNLDGKTEFEVSYALIPKYWGKGFATEMAKTMKAYGIREIETSRLVSIIDIAHNGSAEVARKNGMGILFQTHFQGLDVNVFGVDI